eukprot:PITA_24512
MSATVPSSPHPPLHAPTVFLDATCPVHLLDDCDMIFLGSPKSHLDHPKVIWSYIKGGKGGKDHSFFHEQIGRRRAREQGIFLDRKEKEAAAWHTYQGTSGCCFGLGSAVVSWFSRKQQSLALSSAEAEYMAASLASCEAIWLRKMLFGLFSQPLRPSVIYCDNQNCIKLTENPVFHDRSKHIGIKYHFIRDYVQKGAVKLEYISTDEQVAYILTKALPRGKHVYFKDKMGVVRNTLLDKREC